MRNVEIQLGPNSKSLFRGKLLASNLIATINSMHFLKKLLLPGVLPPLLIKLISEGKANLEGCDGPFDLPSDLSSISDITKIDLSSLKGKLRGDFSGAFP